MTDSFPFDRSALLTPLIGRVRGFLEGYRQNVALVGPEGVGKTTLLRQLLTQIPASSLIPIFLEVQDGETVGEWTARFVQTVLYGISRVPPEQDLPSEWEELIRRTSARAPKTVLAAQKILRLSQQERWEEAYDRLWDLPYQMSQEMGLPCLFLLEEFHRLKALGIRDPFERLGAKIMVQNSTLYLVSSSDPLIARRILREGLGLLFGQFEVLEIGPLDLPAALKAIRSIGKTGNPDPFLEHLLAELTQGYPGRLGQLMEGIDRSRSSSLEQAVLDLLETLFLESSSPWRTLFEKNLRSLPSHSARRIWIQVLTMVAGGIHRVGQVADRLDESSSAVMAALRVLEQAGLVTKQGVFYRVPDRLFQVWLLTAYPVLQGVARIDSALGRARFRDAMTDWIRKTYEAVHRPIEEQVLSLVRQWGGECVEMEGHRILLPVFDRVGLVPGPFGRPVAAAHRAGIQGGQWLLIPWLGPLGELRVRELLREMEGLPFKPYRKVLLGTYSAEMTARWILKEAKVAVWDFRLFNFLLDLYGLVRMPVPAGAAGSLAPTHPIPEAEMDSTGEILS